MPAVKGVGEPCAGEPHARFDVAAGGNRNQSGQHVPHGNQAPPADPPISGDVVEALAANAIAAVTRAHTGLPPRYGGG
jgi:hypothetical protein